MNCQQCGAVTTPEARFCEYCGSALPVSSATQATSLIARGAFKHCTTCGQQIRFDATICDRCGARQRDLSVKSPGRPGPTESLASIGRRGVALFVDDVILTIAYMLFLLAIVDDDSHLWFFVLSGSLYFIIFERVWGQTPGKMLLGLRVVSESGGRITWGQSTGRNLLRYIDNIPYFFPIVGVFLMAKSPRLQRLGDRAANTLVVRE